MDVAACLVHEWDHMEKVKMLSCISTMVSPFVPFLFCIYHVFILFDFRLLN